jgi:hypothetical protein
MIANILDLDPSSKIYRIFRKDLFLKTVQNKRLRLVRPRNWEDPFEDIFFQSSLINNHGEVIHQPYERDRMYGQCWSSLFESDAMWRIYSDRNLLDGIKVQSTVSKLFESLYKSEGRIPERKCFIGKVEYLSTAKIKARFEDENWTHQVQFDSTNSCRAKTLLFKRDEFAHETEIRLIFYEAQAHAPGKYPEYYEFNFEPDKIFECIEVDPRLTSNQFRQLKSELANYYQGRISKSKLYDAPVITPRINIGPRSLRELQQLAIKARNEEN